MRVAKVAWSSLECAYGAADEVPQLLDGLASSNARTRRTALQRCYAVLVHQGSVYSATVAATPFVIADQTIANQALSRTRLFWNNGDLAGLERNLSSSTI